MKLDEAKPMKALVGVDIGGTNTVIGIFDETRTLLKKTVIPTLKPHFPGTTDRPDSFCDALAEAIHALAREAGFTDGVAIVGMGVPGWVDPVLGRAEGASNLGWRGVPFAEQMSRRLGVPVHIDNDVRIYALGEMQAGAGRGYKNALCITIGTGIAVAIVADGRLVRGASFYAGEIGHDAVEGQDGACNCGRRGCVESIVSATGIARLAREALETNGESTSLSRLNRTPTAQDVYTAATAGDAVAGRIFRLAGEVLSAKVLTAVTLLNPEAVIIGGGVAEAGDLLLGPIRERIQARYTFEKKPAILKAALGDSAGLIGAVSYAASY